MIALKKQIVNFENLVGAKDLELRRTFNQVVIAGGQTKRRLREIVSKRDIATLDIGKLQQAAKADKFLPVLLEASTDKQLNKICDILEINKLKYTRRTKIRKILKKAKGMKTLFHRALRLPFPILLTSYKTLLQAMLIVGGLWFWSSAGNPESLLSSLLGRIYEHLSYKNVLRLTTSILGAKMAMSNVKDKEKVRKLKKVFQEILDSQVSNAKKAIAHKKKTKRKN